MCTGTPIHYEQTARLNSWNENERSGPASTYDLPSLGAAPKPLALSSSSKASAPPAKSCSAVTWRSVCFLGAFFSLFFFVLLPESESDPVVAAQVEFESKV